MDAMRSGSNRVARKDDQLVARHIAGETIIVPIRGRLADLQCIYVLDPVGEYIWQQLDGERPLHQILDGILATFDVERERACRDLEAFVEELFDAGLVEGTR
jgi:hypothetical protein